MAPKDPKLLPIVPAPPKNDDPPPLAAGVAPGVVAGVVPDAPPPLPLPKIFEAPEPNPLNPVVGGAAAGVVVVEPAAGGMSVDPEAAAGCVPNIEPEPAPNALVPPKSGLAGVEAGVVDPNPPPEPLKAPKPPPNAAGAGVLAGVVLPAVALDPGADGVPGGCPNTFGGAPVPVPPVPDALLVVLAPKAFPLPPNPLKPENPDMMDGFSRRKALVTSFDR